MDFKQINELKAGTRIDSFYVIKSVLSRVSSNNKKFLDLIVGDKSGEISAKLWDASAEDEELYRENTLVKIRAAVVEWQNNLQLKIDKIRLVTKEDGLDIKNFVPSAPYEADDMYIIMLDYISKIKNKDIKNIVNYIIDKAGDKLMNFPAAKKNHHSVRSGLLYHITTMLKAAEALSNVYVFLNTDLLYSGVILHDMAKLEEMDASELGIVTSYTIEGQLLGHIVMGTEKIAQAAEKVEADIEISMILQHMILSHHYEPEYGSPKKPMIPEAEMLHYLDDMDATMFDMKKAVDSVSPGEVSDPVWSLEKRRIYNSKFDK
ncbi:putative HD-superfamily hydrolase [Clostridium pasteurianum DSM 525 = ATCC 6013]|uniref:Metal dependent phosphohydrolase n=1 Tax=Clostridium pasteurianum DSM 525 = ATCC 6013 TaxID=1262449 RepID=A0A0H3J2U6_CLOPA|nr:OB-fold nucleic acid binding domain-containing protein [Clostridium pasteurianum]AJA48246.1 putative HD-superfamily hydrolase [Clostridium pasteurianum DSM 525 = ATCC 6013]AJA52234.1 putative HD-superfamily hydrolase [Clostridium pasteurianum DSM 525 = ATCC 6013]AOZ75502.1 CMP-binding protein [Clostridium pasteurianum DSM 525 = ATCC 6013]AOZ79297.1 CMP-binding protein [Clostridium pasteurianum]ELP60604.1 HD-hydrolase domain containing protein [Clostridium pasteurianum DSM 525 = ATCC 6013]